MLTTIGLIFDLAGVVMLFKYPPLAPEHEQPAGDLVVAETPDKAETDRKARQRLRYSWLSKVALGLLAIGFSLQILDITLLSGGAKATDVLSAIADFGTLVIGAGAVFISWTAYQSSRKHMNQVENHALMSIKPALSTWAEYPSEQNDYTCEITIGNKGFGPAICEQIIIHCDEMEISYSGMDKMRKAILAAFGEDTEIIRVSIASYGYALGQNETSKLAVFRPKQTSEEAVEQALSRLTLNVFYKDIYNNHWRFMQHGPTARTERMQNPQLSDKHT